MTGDSGKAATHWPLLDFMRANAALLVVFAHSRAFYFLNVDQIDRPGPLLWLFYFITDLGHQAVVIFFILSGFLIGGSLTKSIRQGRFDLVRYLIARFARIYAVYFPALIITQLIFLFGLLVLNDPPEGPLTSHLQLDFGGVAQAICFVSGLQGFSCRAWEQNPALWSLGYEWALYLFAPAILLAILWNASRGLRLLTLVLICAIALTICHYPKEAVFWFSAWFGGALSRHVLQSRPLPLPAGVAGVALIVAGMVLRHERVATELETDSMIAIGAAVAIACRPLVSFPLAPRFFGWAADFSYTLYAIHLPLVFFTVAAFQGAGFPRVNVAPAPAPFLELGVTIAVCVLGAFLVSRVFETRTGQIRSALMNLRQPAAGPPEDQAGAKTPQALEKTS
ncbi:acyltransferase family protein [Methylocapsa palsarum]|uniref:Peptidoglycan/LPS O-acetylase OafA/YrhL, contains acyltransferase and SGNH-hydrolase domains n=1 Tax=Methylocapsa palsarum TaxID=1612308 RepID=A0A1I3VXW8_9HYPH|nr:acyltransferase [Methylocapsa palsarum]SFJ99066.1 Peptidoglycan/LPS O-acetylase OafA/YrhL, contains acyltransferase and SGNH-hydrolase domains [Methylocapsa palsarum]